MEDEGSRLVAGFLATAVVSVVACRAGALSAAGSAAALAVGVAATAAGWSWTAVLLAFFCSSSILTRWRASFKVAAVAGVTARVGPRDARQVAANGGVFAACAVWSTATADAAALVAGFGALAAATADTWATEVGTAIGGVPRSATSGRAVPPGTSGAVSIAGSAAMLLGATLIGVAALAALREPAAALAIGVGGVAGALVDTVIGATIQQQRWCPVCGRPTERAAHTCGSATVHHRGLAFMSNDVVNLTSTVAGAAAALAWWTTG